MKHYTFKIHLRDGIVEGGAVGDTFEQALAVFNLQPEVVEFVKEHGPVDHTELISTEEPEEATPEAARQKGLESLALATTERLAGIEQHTTGHRRRIGQELREARLDCDMTIEEVASHCMVKPITVRHIEEGKFAASIDILSKMADCYGCEIGVCDIE